MKYTILIFFLMLGGIMSAQRDCGRNNPDYIPLNDLGTGSFRGFQGGLYAGGSNVPSGAYRLELMERAGQIVPLDSNGIPSPTGKIVFIGVGASNPRTEFQAFQLMTDTFTNLNPAVVTVNTCLGGQGVQKMNDPADNYWKNAAHMLDSTGVHAEQVQVAWLETENTQKGDTSFPGAPVSLIGDLRVLLQTMKAKYPNLKLCFLSARAYAGWTSGGTGKGLEFPRDYYNGWALKWLIDSAVSGSPGLRYKGMGPEIPMPVYSTYNWTNKEDVRKDGFSLNCLTDIGNDGLHLSAAGEIKLGRQIFDFFTRDSSSLPWFLASGALAVSELQVQGLPLKLWPNPVSDMLNLEVENGDGESAEFSIYGPVLNEMVRIRPGSRTSLDVSMWPAGVYTVVCRNGDRTSYARFVKW